jgi:phosphate transport system substrate-binding protein
LPIFIQESMMKIYQNIKLLSKYVGFITFILVSTVGLSACGDQTRAITQEQMGTDRNLFQNAVNLSGAGTTFPAPLYRGWLTALNQDIPNLSADYQSVGSRVGIEKFSANTVDFGASDVAMNDAEIAAIKGEVLMLPMTAGSIVMAYNLPGLEGLKLSQGVLAEILLGKITRWDDPKLKVDNPGLNLPNKAITVIHRSDGSGTTEVFTKNLSSMNTEFKQTIGEGKTVTWPTNKGKFIGAPGNEGVTVAIKQNEGAIGYIEYSYAINNGLTMALLQNKAGNFIAPTQESASQVLAQVDLPENMRAFVVNAPGPEAYPIVSYSWLLVRPNYDDPEKAKGMEVIIEYGLNQGQSMAQELGYVPLPKTVREKVAAAADQLSPDYSITLE